MDADIVHKLSVRFAEYPTMRMHCIDTANTAHQFVKNTYTWWDTTIIPTAVLCAAAAAAA